MPEYQDGIPCLWMRGGTSKGAYFLVSDLPESVEERDALLLGIMGSPDPRQIDGIGGADPLTSKVAVLGPPTREDADVDYLFLQVFVDQGQSLNLMVHPKTPAKMVSDLMIQAWQMGLKSLYYQRSTNPAQEMVRNILTCSSCEA